MHPRRNPHPLTQPPLTFPRSRAARRTVEGAVEFRGAFSGVRVDTLRLVERCAGPDTDLRKMGDHFYTIHAAERDFAVANLGYAFEGTGAWVWPVEDVPDKPGDHAYTTVLPYAEILIASWGYQRETDAGWVFDVQKPGTVPLYHAWDAQTADNVYTTSAVERQSWLTTHELIGGWTCWVYDHQVPNTVPFYRLYNVVNGDHFYTTSAAERANAKANFRYVDEGIACYIYSAQQAGTVPLYRLAKTRARVPFWRLRSPATGDHFYTVSTVERDAAVRNGWIFEGQACTVFATPGAPLVPLYRLANPLDHFYTLSAAERDAAVPLGYVREGVACHVAGGPLIGTVPLYRLFGPSVTPPQPSGPPPTPDPNFEPWKWNDFGVVQKNNNCYNYGCDIRTGTYAQPGRGGGSVWNFLLCADVGRGARVDGLVATSATGCSPGCHLAALVIWPNSAAGPGDFHWYRRDRNGLWSHKPGSLAATNLDQAGNLISDPRTAARGNYVIFCGFFCVCKASVRIS